MPPPAEGFAARFVVGPALRTQPDRRLVTLVREGYENAFEEIVRRYGKPLTRYAAAIVGSRAEDVTQDAFSKALLALRRDGRDIELRPWLFRIVRNTALNDLRDRPPSAEALAEAIAGGSSPEEEIERRQDLADLMRRLQALPEAQRAAIVMRELEGLSHDEIASALGLSGGAARQAIFRARRALRDGAGMLLPLPLVKALLAGAAAAPVEAAAGAAGVGGAGVAIKATAATVLMVGAVGAGVAIDHDRQPSPAGPARAAGVMADDVGGSTPAGVSLSSEAESGDDSSGSSGRGRNGEPGDDRGGQSGEGGRGDGHGSGRGRGDGPGDDIASLDDSGGGGGGGGGHPEPSDDHGGSSGSSGHGGAGGAGGGGHGSGGSSSGHSGGSSGSNGGSSGPGGGLPGSGSGSSGGSGTSGSSSPGGSGSDPSSSGSGGPGPSPGDGSGPSDGSEGSATDDSSSSSGSGDSHGGSGFSLQTQPQS